MWTVQLLGTLRASRSEAVLDRFRTRKTGSILGYLAYHLGTPAPREVLAELYWPDSEPWQSRQNVNVAISWLRERLVTESGERSIILSDRHSVWLDPEGVRTDVGRFQEQLRLARRAAAPDERLECLRAALDAYAGGFLPGYYEEWVAPVQQYLDGCYFEALHTASGLLVERRELATALHYSRHATTIDPLRSENQMRVIRLLAELRRPAEAVHHYHQYYKHLKKELGVEPPPEMRGFIAELQRQMALAAAQPSPPPVREAAPAAPVAPPALAVEAARSGPLTDPPDDDDQDGAVPLGSKYYVKRELDDQLVSALRQRASIIQIKGSRQTGKSSLLARGIAWGREHGVRVALTDIQLFNAEQFRSADMFLLAVAQEIADSLGSSVDPDQMWTSTLGANVNFRRFMRKLLAEEPEAALLWAVDNLEPLFKQPYAVDVFSLIRTWHNERALTPGSPWSRLSVALCFAVEAHLLIPDNNQSPFNVGTRLEIGDFEPAEVEALNGLYSRPLASPQEHQELRALVGGHPFLVRSGLRELSRRNLSVADLSVRSTDDDSLYGEHLRRMRDWLKSQEELLQSVWLLLEGKGRPSQSQFHTLRSAGICAGAHWQEARLRCELYARYLRQERESLLQGQ